MFTKWYIHTIIRFALLLAILLLGFYFASANIPFAMAAPTASIRYVATTGSDSGPCTVSPCKGIQYAVNQSGSGDTIKVAQGTYTYNGTADICSFLLTRAVICLVDKVLTIFGGYSTSNWLVANPSANVTVIDGQNTYRGVAVVGYQTTTTNLDMEGFTIQNGRAQGPTYNNPYDPTGVGGGMWVQVAAVTLRNVIFRYNNVYGQNTTSGAGGAAAGAGLRIESSPAGTSSLLDQVTFDHNISYGGTGPARGGIAFGAFFSYASNVTVQNSTFTNNQAIAGNSSGSGTFNGLNADALGGAIGFENGSGILTGLTISNNQAIGGNAATTGGGGYGAGIYFENTSSLQISDSTVQNNQSRGGNATNGGFGAGAGILLSNVPATIQRTMVIANTATGGNSTGSGYAGPPGGAGIYLWAASSGNFNATLTNVIIANNLAQAGSGNSALGGGGGGIQIQGVAATLNHVTLAGNQLGSTLVSGQALLALASPNVGPATVYLNYSIIANHTTGRSGASAVLVQTGNTLTFNDGMFAGNTKNTNSDGSPMPVGTINGLSTMQSTQSAGFVSPGAPNYNYHLSASSPARDQAVGSPIKDDAFRMSRPYNTVPDLGASEYWPPTTNQRSLYLPLIRR